MSITLIQSSQIGDVAFANRVLRTPTCFCGRYIFYSAACGHIHTGYVLKCGHGISKIGNPTFCNTPAAHHIMSNHRVVDPCDQCRPTTTPPTRREEQAAGPSPDHPTQGLPAGAISSSMTLFAGGSSPNRPPSSTPAGAVNDYLALPTANVPPGSSTGTPNMGSNTQSHGMFGVSITQNGGVFGFFAPPRG